MSKLPAILLAAFGFANFALSQQPYAMPAERETSFDQDWRFHNGEYVGAESPAYDDSGWRKLDLPHDFAIEGAFAPHSPAGAGGGYLTAGTAWYRKTFTIPDSEKDLRHVILFDGVYMNAEVYLNGAHLGDHPYGYTSFYYDLTPQLHYGSKPNVIAVHVKVLQPSSRWYSGAGIYRHVHLITTDPVRIDPWGVVVSTPEADAGHAKISIVTNVSEFREMKMPTRQYIGHEIVRTPLYYKPDPDPSLKVVNTIIDPGGNVVSKQTATQDASTATGSSGNDILPFRLSVSIPHPSLWSPETPALYRVKSEVFVADKLVDTIETPFGIRTSQFTADKGFLLNGKPYPIHGVCDHHDLGCLGSAAYRRGIERQLEILKTIGVNAIRTSHNPPSPEFLDLCDSMGFLVMDEAFDEWKQSKTQFGYGHYFDDWSEPDIVSMVDRDRNHPSVILWSIGNEIPEQQSPDGGAMAKRLADIVRREDPTRPVTSACNDASHAISTGFAAALDVLGINYNIGQYTEYKGRVLIGSETASAISSRGEYNLLAGKDGKLEIKAEYNHQMSSYDTEAPPWATRVEPSLTALRDCPWVAGQFVWTGFDYIGEPTPFGWPSRSSYFGIFDTCGFPKDRAYLYQSQWTDKPMVHLLPHWNWEGYEGKIIPVRCYTNADTVELFLNGKSLGMHEDCVKVANSGHESHDTYRPDQLHFEWKVPYAPGVLKAVAMNNRKVVATDEVRTAGPPAKIVLFPDRGSILTDGKDLAFITIRIEDKDGNPCPNASNTVKLSIKGPGDIIGTDNGDPTDLASFQSPARKAFHGLALVVIKSMDMAPGSDIVLTADAKGLAPATVKIATPGYINKPDSSWLRHSPPQSNPPPQQP